MASQAQQRPQGTKVRPLVLYIVSSSRSGSTVLDLALGNFRGATAVGEVRNLAGNGLARQGSCGCGDRLQECEFWQSVFHNGSTRLQQVWNDPNTAVDEQEAVSRTRHFLRVLRGEGRFLNSAAQESHRAYMEQLYLSAAIESGSDVVVDSSKAPIGAAELNLLPSLNSFVLHLVRDPRAVAFSVLTPKRQTGDPTGRQMTSGSAGRAALMWDTINVQAELLRKVFGDRFLRVRYEDLVENPDETLEYIWRRIIATGALQSPPVLRGQPQTHHTAWGNPVREGDQTTIRWQADERWRAGMTSKDRFISWALSWPLHRRYGYL